jgi:hypothetical protein
VGEAEERFDRLVCVLRGYQQQLLGNRKLRLDKQAPSKGVANKDPHAQF